MIDDDDDDDDHHHHHYHHHHHLFKKCTRFLACCSIAMWPTCHLDKVYNFLHNCQWHFVTYSSGNMSQAFLVYVVWCIHFQELSSSQMECLLSLMLQQWILSWRSSEPVLYAVLSLKLGVDFMLTAGRLLLTWQVLFANFSCNFSPGLYIKK